MVNRSLSVLMVMDIDMVIPPVNKRSRVKRPVTVLLKGGELGVAGAPASAFSYEAD